MHMFLLAVVCQNGCNTQTCPVGCFYSVIIASQRLVNEPVKHPDLYSIVPMMDYAHSVS